MNNEMIALAEHTNNLLKNMNNLIASSINDVDSLQYEIEFRQPNRFAMSKSDEFSIKKTLSNDSSKYLLNELIKSTKIIEDALSQIGFKSSDEYPKFNMVDTKEIDDIELRLKTIKDDGFFSTNSLEKIKELNKYISDIESFIMTINEKYGQYTISKKSKIMFFKSSKNKVTFNTVYCLDEKYLKFYNTLNSLRFGVHDSLEKEKAKLTLERVELKD